MIGYKIINNLSKKFSFAINWQDKTFKTPDEKIKEVNKKIPVLNINCNDISKQNIGVVFKKIFGYSLDINPKKYGGKCVRKPNLNASGIGHVINCPSKKEKGFAYEKLINTKNNEGLLVDFRVPIFKDIIPCVQLRYKSPNPIFIDSLKKIEIKESKEIFSKSELKKIFLFCKRLGMDYGELDILRDKDNNKIYIVDANTTPFGPHGLPRKITKEILKKSSIAFAEMIKNN
ncbi:MAG TPA: hypothetical protein ENH46_05925 [Candidatus Pacearchaeota archaeon]|nr:hypothetical protein [Candidatus Pacearchaeota archaeon]